MSAMRPDMAAGPIDRKCSESSGPAAGGAAGACWARPTIDGPKAATVAMMADATRRVCFMTAGLYGKSAGGVFRQDAFQRVDRDRADRAAVGGDVGRLEQRVVHRFLGRLEHGLEQAGYAVGGQHRTLLWGRGARDPLRRVRRERDREI